MVLALVFPGAGLGLAAGFELCLWLSLTPITESCYWEPKSWVPRDPRGIFWQDSGRKHALLTSGMVSGWCSKPVSGAGTVPCGAWVLSLWWLSGVVWDESPSLVQQMQFDCIHYVLETTCTTAIAMSPKLEKFCPYFVPLIGDKLAYKLLSWKTILLFENSFQNLTAWYWMNEFLFLLLKGAALQQPHF